MRSLKRIASGITAVMLVSSCSPANDSKNATAKPDSVLTRAPLGAAPGGPACPATGLWARCSVLYRLERAGIAPKIDSTDTERDKVLSGERFVVKFGADARLEVFLYPDSAARVADAAKLDRTTLVSATAPLTIKRERTLIENANLLGLLTSLNDRLRERVSDALSAGAPQPAPK